MSNTANYEEIQQKARCNWCRQDLIYSEPISEANFIDVGKKYPALFCSRCLNDDFRKGQPKMVINLTTYDEYYIEDIPDKAEHEVLAAAKLQSTQEQLSADEAVRKAGTTSAASQAEETKETNKTEET